MHSHFVPTKRPRTDLPIETHSQRGANHHSVAVEAYDASTSQHQTHPQRLQRHPNHPLSPLPIPYNNFNPPVTPSTTLLGPGPTPKHVTLPALICVLPASLTTLAQSPAPTALACNSIISSSLLTCSATFACPPLSHRFNTGLFGEWVCR